MQKKLFGTQISIATTLLDLLKKLLLFCLLEMVNKDIIRAERDSKVSRRDSGDVTLR